MNKTKSCRKKSVSEGSAALYAGLRTRLTTLVSTRIAISSKVLSRTERAPNFSPSRLPVFQGPRGLSSALLTSSIQHESSTFTQTINKQAIGFYLKLTFNQCVLIKLLYRTKTHSVVI